MATTLVMSHWSNLIENLQASPLEFYGLVEGAIRNRNIPEASTSRVDWQEGGLLSAKREYLRVSRGKNIFDVCGAPFGNGFFVSWWLGEPRPSPVGPSLAAIGAIFLLWLILRSGFGIFGGFFITILVLVVAFFAVGALISQSSEEEWVVYLLVIPGLGPFGSDGSGRQHTTVSTRH